jgi:hypothetical protein
VKQKHTPLGIVGRLFNPNKGKENADDSLRASLSNKNNASSAGTLSQRKKLGVHTVKSCEALGGDRRVLTSASAQNNNSPNVAGKPLKTNSLPNSVKLQESFQGNNNDFGFEIEDLDENGTETGWKTYTSRGTKSNPNRSKEGRKLANGNVSPSMPNNADNAMDDSDNSYDDDSNETNESSRKDQGIDKRPSNASLSGGVGSFPGSSGTGSNSGISHSQRKIRGEKEKPRGRKEMRNCMVRRIERFAYLWAAHLISAVAWLVKLITDVVTLSFSVGSTL